jgi:hypothetical protein
MWHPEAQLSYGLTWTQQQQYRYRPSSAWTDHIIIHDDNFGMYLCLPVDSLRKAVFPYHDPTFRATAAFGVMRHKIVTPWFEPEVQAVWLVRKGLDFFLALFKTPWLSRIADIYQPKLHKKTPLVTRTTLCTSDKYREHLRLKRDREWHGERFSAADIDLMTAKLPSFFWLTEITLPDLYTARRCKLIDLLYRCDLPARPPQLGTLADERIIQARLPGFVIFWPEMIAEETSVLEYFPLLQSDLKGTVDW